MSLISGLTAEPPPKPFENVALENGKAICMKHQEDLNLLYLSKGLFAKKNNLAVCSKCEKPEGMTSSCSATFQTSSKNACCIISPNLSSGLATTVKNPDLDLEQHVVEHVLWDKNSNGYELKSLVNMKDLRVLAACSKNGSVCFWSIGDQVELKEPRLILKKKIRFAKYCMISNEKKYLAIGTDKGVHIYHIAGGEISSIISSGVIDEGEIVSDLDFLEEEREIVTVYNGSIAKVWNLDTLEMEKMVDLHQYGINGEIHTAIYVKRTGELAIEYEKGLSIIKDWKLKDGSVRHHFVDEKKSFGCRYLPNLRRFILNNCPYVEILEEKDFEGMARYKMPTGGLFGDDVSPKKFLVSQDESAIISNGVLSQIYSFKEQDYKKYYLNNFIWGLSDVELIEDQYRIAVANPTKGTVTIMRVNANTNIERGEGLSLLPAVFSTEKKLDVNPTSGGGLFSGGGGSGGSLFSGISSGGSLLSGKASGGGLLLGGGSGGSLFSGVPSRDQGRVSGGSLFSGGGSGGSLFSRNTAPSFRNPPPRVNNTSLFSGNTSKKSTKPKPKQTSKPAKKGKKIQKIQVRSVAAAKKKKEKSAPSLAKKGKKALKAESSKSQNKNLIEAVRIRGKKKTKKEEEKVWVVLPSATDDEKKRGRSLNKKNTSEKNKTKRKADISEDRSRSRSKSKSVTRKK